MNTTGTNVLLCAHDAGGANILAAWARKNPSAGRVRAILDGPARAIFGSVAPGVPLAGSEDLDALDPAPDFVLCGSSWASGLERKVLSRAGRMGIRRAVFLDHWVNYASRFESRESWPGSLPEEIWTGDELALKAALSEGFPPDRLHLVPNPYHALLSERFARIPAQPHAGTHLLFLSEAVSAHALTEHGHGHAMGYTEQGQLERLLDCLPALAGTIAAVRVRPHPAHPPGTFDALKRHTGLAMPLEVSENAGLLEDLAWCDVAIGMESEALAVASEIAGRTAVSCLPPQAPSCRLPHPGIVRIRDFEELRRILHKEQTHGR
jgi:hypothetical protein